MVLRAVIFDLYGVLALNGWQAFKARHFQENDDAWGQLYQLGRQVDAGLSDYAEFVRFAAEVTGEHEETVRYQLEHTLANTELLDFIRNELQSEYKLGILSNASNDEIIERIFTPEQRGLFDTVTLSHHVGMTKPDVHMYEVASAKLGLQPGECVFIDDQERHTAGARAAGMRSILYTDVADLKRELAKVS